MNVQIICPQCRRKHIGVLYVMGNVCSSCGAIFASSALVQLRGARLALFGPAKKEKKELNAEMPRTQSR